MQSAIICKMTTDSIPHAKWVDRMLPVFKRHVEEVLLKQLLRLRNHLRLQLHQICYHLQLYLSEQFYEMLPYSACTLGFAIHVEARTPPKGRLIYSNYTLEIKICLYLDQSRFRIRAFSRCQSLAFSAWRLSCCFLPRANPTRHLIR